MPRSHYYDDLSGDSSDGCASGSDCDDFADEAAIEGFIWGTNPPRSNDEKLQGKHQRTVVHADVDCFYCQCEMIDRGLDPKRPLAIGQKHIVVTCNYAAREAGVTKLMSRDEARRRCPHLQVVEGSDLERYRVHGRKIYESFRRAFLKLRPGSAVCKGSMDEMMAQLNTTSAAAGLKGVKSNDQFNSNDVYVYDDQAVTMTEDQTGARTVVFQGARYAETDEAEDPDTFHSLLDTASIALQVRQIVYDETGFTTTIGVSCSPMLAKLASGLHKPGKVNILKPGSSSRRLVESMPLRKVPGIGSRTIKVLEPCLASSSRGDVSSPWTCRDLLSVCRNDIIRCLEKMKSTEKSSADLCSTLVELCSGQDESCIVDDQGCLQKTLSVENSFRRGTIRTKESVINVMEDLYRRLPRLLKDRTAWSIDPSRAYPTTIRLTVRSVVEGDVRRRPFETHSQQIAFDGRPLVSETLNEKDAAEFLRRFLAPLLKSLVLSSGDINVTKLNIGVTNFQDIPASSAKAQNNRASSAVPHRTSVVVQPTASSVTARNLVNAEEIQRDSEDKRASRSFAAFNDWMLSSSDNKESNVKVKVSKSVSCSKRNAALKLSLNKIDPTVLSELPPEIAAETLKGLHCLEPSTRKRRIDQFFAPK